MSVTDFGDNFSKAVLKDILRGEGNQFSVYFKQVENN